MTPFASILINTHNHERFIEEAIDSVLAQDYPTERMEIIVVDDGSTDGTSERVRKYGGRIRYFRTKNGDQCSAVTFGVGQARGDLVAMLDGDDLWLPNKLSRVAEEFAKDPRVVMIYHRYVFWDCRDNTVWEPKDPNEISGDILADRRKLLSYWPPPMSSLTFRRSAFDPLRRIPLDRAFAYDTFLTCASPFLGRVACIPEVLTKNRVHGNNRWVAGKDGPDETTIRRRIARWKAATDILRDWIWANAPESLRPRARLLLRRHYLGQEGYAFMLKAPGRFRRFAHQCRGATVDPACPSRTHLAYRFLHAFAGLIVGDRARYLEGVRTRVNRLRRRLQRPPSAKQTVETAGPVR